MSKWSVALLGALLGACAGQSKKQEAEVAVLADWLPGRYDSSSLEISIVRARVPRIGDHVFYVQEMEVMGGERRLVAQRLWSLDPSPDGNGILQRIWSLTEPARWREGVGNPDLFKSVMPQDFAQLSGCDLIWKREGEKFIGSNDAAACRVSSQSTGSMVRWSLRTELGPTDLAIADEAFDMAGRPIQPRAADPFHRFQKR